MWQIFHDTDYGEPRILLDSTIANTEDISQVQSSGSSSAKRIGHRCVDRPVGKSTSNEMFTG